MGVDNFVIGCWSHHNWLLHVNNLLLGHLSVHDVALLRHVDWLRLDNVSNWLSNWHRHHLWLLLTLLSNLLSLCLGLFLFEDLLLVGLEMGRKVELGEEPAVAVLTSEPLLSLMDLHMLVQVGFLGE